MVRTAEAVVSDAAEVEEKKIVMLRSKDGVEFVMSDAEASQCGIVLGFRIECDFDNHIIPSDAGSEINYSPIDLFFRGDTLSKVIQYSKMHASGSQDFSEWDAKFIGHLCHETLIELILAAKYLCNQGLLHLTCQTVANVIKGKSFDEIRDIFNIRRYVTNLRSTIGAKKVDTLDKWLTATSSPAVDEDPVLTLEKNAVKALHIVRCQEFTVYDPKWNESVRTRFHGYNIAFFDLDKESRIVRGPRFDSMFLPLSTYCVGYSVNVISLKVIESLVGDDLRIFGTVVARDEVDYRCIYLFRREKDDAQAIALPDGMLTLTDPCRGLVLLNQIYFEIDLKIRCDGGEIKDFSRGVVSLEGTRFPVDRQTMTVSINSLLSSVELACAYVVQPVEATIAINMLKGACNISRVSAWVSGDTIILYDNEADNTQKVIGDSGSSVPLTRRVVAVPFDEKLVLTLVDNDNTEKVHLTVGLSDRESVCVCKMGLLGEVQVKVAWTVIRKRRSYEFEIIGNEILLHEG